MRLSISQPLNAVFIGISAPVLAGIVDLFLRLVTPNMVLPEFFAYVVIVSALMSTAAIFFMRFSLRRRLMFVALSLGWIGCQIILLILYSFAIYGVPVSD